MPLKPSVYYFDGTIWCAGLGATEMLPSHAHNTYKNAAGYGPTLIQVVKA